MSIDLKEWLNSINLSKENLMDVDPDAEREYPPFIINKCLSGQMDALMQSNEMNKFPNLDKRLQYDFYINSLRKRKRFSPWLRKDKVKNIEAVRQYYGFSTEKAEQALNILSNEQLDYIYEKLNTGGSSPCKQMREA
jgi:hypothetical protein